ncbi:MAG: hypothetical protein Crog4KO_13130 [Crocinitomicaceae bacterium]
MKPTLFFLLITLLSGTALAEEKRIASPFVRQSVKDAPNLGENKALFEFEFQNLDNEDLSAQITLSINGEANQTIQLKKGKFEYKVAPGSHLFTIYINDKYFELYSNYLEIKAQQKHEYHIFPRKTMGMMIEVDKPVIYLYPEQSEAFEVSVNPVGDMAFTYPKYDRSWTGIMHPDGKLTVDGEDYNYLFWESKQAFDALNPKTTAGFMVEQNNVVSFLEKQLEAVGFTASERADFITFWGPQMQKHEQVFVTFHQDTECNAFAELDISPTPDNLHRFYMSWGPHNGNSIPEAQELKPFNRNGFTAIEWGGQEIPTISNSLSL